MLARFRLKNLRMSWKVQLAPALLILILIGLGVAGLQTLRMNKTNVDELIAGPRGGKQRSVGFSRPKFSTRCLYRAFAQGLISSDLRSDVTSRE